MDSALFFTLPVAAPIPGSVAANDLGALVEGAAFAELLSVTSDVIAAPRPTFHQTSPEGGDRPAAHPPGPDAVVDATIAAQGVALVLPPTRSPSAFEAAIGQDDPALSAKPQDDDRHLATQDVERPPEASSFDCSALVQPAPELFAAKSPEQGLQVVPHFDPISQSSVIPPKAAREPQIAETPQSHPTISKGAPPICAEQGPTAAPPVAPEKSANLVFAAPTGLPVASTPPVAAQVQPLAGPMQSETAETPLALNRQMDLPTGATTHQTTAPEQRAPAQPLLPKQADPSAQAATGADKPASAAVLTLMLPRPAPPPSPEELAFRARLEMPRANPLPKVAPGHHTDIPGPRSGEPVGETPYSTAPTPADPSPQPAAPQIPVPNIPAFARMNAPLPQPPSLAEKIPTAPVSHQAAATLAQHLPSQPDRIELTLTPDDLGRLRFDMRRQGDDLYIVMSAERPETLDLMRRQLPDLMAELKQAGVQGGTLSFGAWSDRGPAAQHQNGTAFLAQTDAETAPPRPQTPPPARLSGKCLDLRL